MNSKLIVTTVLSITSLAVFAQEVNKTGSNGKREGKWMGYYEKTNNLRYEGSFINGVEQGTFTYYADDLQKKIIATRDFSKGNGNAYTVFYDGKGKKMSEGNFKNKSKEGRWIEYHQGGTQILNEEYYVNGKLEGVRKVYYKSGKVSEELGYKKGIQHGISNQYAENGVKLREETYENGLQHGKAIYRDADGKITLEGEYDHGKKIGEWAKQKPVEVKPKSKK